MDLIIYRQVRPTIAPLPKQHIAYQKLQDKTTKYIIFGGGAGGGKSWLGAEWLLTRCYFWPNTRWFIGRNELKRLLNSSYITFEKVCHYHKIPKEDWKLNGQQNYIDFTNGSRIDLLDVAYQPSDPLYERFGSTEYTGGWLEEAGEIDFRAFDVLKSRIGRYLNKEYEIPSKMLITCNPKKNWLYAYVYKPSRDGTLDSKYAFIKSLYSDNVYTAEEYGKNLEEIKDEVLRRRLKDGDWEYDKGGNKLIEYDAICDLNFTKLKPSQDKYLTIDVAREGKDRAVMLYWEGFQVKRFYVYDRSKLDFLQNQAREACQEYMIPRSHVIADEDGVGGGFVDNFACKGFTGNANPIQPLEAKKEPDKRVNYANLRTQCYYMLAQKINAREIGIDENEYIEYTKEELEQVARKDSDKEGKLKIIPKDEIKSNIGRSPDFADALMMRMYFELQNSFEPTEEYEHDYARGLRSLLHA